MRTTSIEWTDVTWNPVRGCSRVSEGCRNCYAERVAARFSTHALQNGETPGGTFAGFAEMTPNGARWTGNVALVPSKLDEPLRWKKPCRVFVNSMSDLFHEKLPDQAIVDVFGIMALAPRHTFQILTKRADRMLAFVAAGDHGIGRQYRAMQTCGGRAPGWFHRALDAFPRDHFWQWPLPNVWLGVSVENQETAEQRIPQLLATPAAVRFLSVEPLLGPIDLHRYLWIGEEGGIDWSHKPRQLLSWVIVGGESGPDARPMHPDWVRAIRDQCVAAAVPFFFKQFGTYRPGSDFTDDGRSICIDRIGRIVAGPLSSDKFPSQASSADGWECMRRVGKKAAGRELDGQTWNQYPVTAIA